MPESFAAARYGQWMPAIAITATTLALGAALGFVPAYLMERTKQRSQLSTRWDAELYRLCGEFAGVGRQMMHATGRLDGQPGELLGPAAAASEAAPSQRIMDELPRFYRAVRIQLRVPSAEQVDRVPFGSASNRASD